MTPRNLTRDLLIGFSVVGKTVMGIYQTRYTPSILVKRTKCDVESVPTPLYPLGVSWLLRS